MHVCLGILLLIYIYTQLHECLHAYVRAVENLYVRK